MILQFFLQIFGFARQTADEEREWMIAVQSGDKTALKKLYDRFSKILFGMIYKILHNKEEAEDLLQEIFVKIWNRADQYDPSRGTVYSFIATLARNRAIDRTRSRAFKNRRKDDYVINDDEYSFHLSTDNPNPEEKIELSERAVGVRKALAELNKKERQVLYISYFEGLSQSEIAEKIDIPLGTVKYRMRQGMIKLRDMLTE
ncbi:MAG: sigma-70 family RNA polymerase sigma factor [Bacteroidetes bacterium]|nr:sigma-70 family RNA polymerase sigma factor [Bacteroidota bacterium]